jgi:hypothetical protein
MPNFQVDSKVISTEHPNSIGTVIRVNHEGALTIEWVTPPRPGLPLGHSVTEFWPVSEQHLLEVAE